MPELPEVETIRRQLEKEAVGRRIKGVDVRFSGRLNVKPAVLAKALVSSRIIAARRRAKLLFVDFSSGWTLVLHLKMTGRLLLVPAKTRPGKHDHLVFHLNGGRDLFFEDVRKFGYQKLIRTEEVEEAIVVAGDYGPEPLEPGFTLARFTGCLRKFGRKKIKPSLLDQTCLAGIGNIYADESLWRARIRPERRVATLGPAELKALYAGVRDSLKISIRNRGTSADDYLDLYGKKGTNEAALKAYGREGLKCRRCGGLIAKVRLAGRGTHYCPRCQK
ncbi:MAG: bifunctional DNA-formamidopyrimidine glycosylase/DNA-(apurinic or apyrimidinic site) lyase [Patescibacteria group bacterium]|jgi:formamidopyrimidine-DNA glycosylase